MKALLATLAALLVRANEPPVINDISEVLGDSYI